MPNCWSTIFSVLLKIDDAKLIWQTLGDALVAGLFVSLPICESGADLVIPFD
jgi:hypothetical protein